MSLNMLGHIDATFESTIATRAPNSGSYVAGKWVSSAGGATTHSVNLQPLTDKEIDFLNAGGERVVAGRKLYINDGITSEIAEAYTWVFEGVTGTFKAVKVDNRPWRNYCKVIITRADT